MLRGQNILADGLATSAATCKIPFRSTRPYTVEVKCRSTVPDNIKYWKVFGNDDQIDDFLQCKNDFECTNIDLECEDANVNNSDFEFDSVNTIDLGDLGDDEIGTEFLQLKRNILPRGLVPSEDLFDCNDVAKKPKIEAHRQEVEECNIGTEEKPRMIKLSKSLPPEQKLKYIELFKEYSDVKRIGLIKDFCITLVQIPAKSMVMDVVVAEILPKYGMLLSRSWGAKLKGTLQLDMSYATIPVFGKQRRLYRETLMKYMVSSQEKLHNYPLYSTHSDLDTFILYNDGDTEEKDTQLMEDLSGQDEGPENIEVAQMKNVITEELSVDFWSMDFDGAVSKEGARAGVWLHNHRKRYSENHSYKLNFQCTNNVVEYEALMLGLKLLKKVGAKQIMVRGDSELIIK
jgi:hypothetical protein